jgi:hypothetical protein
VLLGKYISPVSTFVLSEAVHIAELLGWAGGIGGSKDAYFTLCAFILHPTPNSKSPAAVIVGDLSGNTNIPPPSRTITNLCDIYYI